MSVESWKLYIVGLPSRVYYYNIIFLSDSQVMYIYCTLYMHDILCAIKVKSWTSSDVRAAAKKSRGQQHFCQECTIVVHCPPTERRKLMQKFDWLRRTNRRAVHFWGPHNKKRGWRPQVAAWHGRNCTSGKKEGHITAYSQQGQPYLKRLNCVLHAKGGRYLSWQIF